MSVYSGGAIPACIAGGIPAYLAAGLQGGGILACLAGFQALTQGGSWEGSGGSTGPQSRGKLRRIWPGGLQVHTQGGSWRGSGRGRGCLQAHIQGVSRPTPRGVPAPEGGLCSRGDVEIPRDGYCCDRYASYWNAFLFKYWCHSDSHRHTMNLPDT